MTPEKLFAELLGLGLKWRVTECVFHKDRRQVDLQLEHTDEVWKLERCPKCGAEAKGYDRTEPLRWRHLNVMQYRCEIVARLPRGRCPQCGHTWRVRPPWEGKAGGFSNEFEAFALLLLREMAVERAAQTLGETAPRLWRLLHKHVDAAYAEADFSAVSCVGVDEMSVRKGHKYISVFADLLRKRVLFAAEDRDSSVFPQFIEALEAHNGHRHALTEVSMDLSPAYLKGVRETCRNAAVVHDKYHVIANLILATERVRRREQKQRPELKDSQWLLRKNPENLSAEQTAELAVLTQGNLASVKAYQMRLAFQDAYRLEHAGAARRRLEAWCRWVRSGRQKFGALFVEMVKFAESVERHLEGILAHWKHRVTNAFMEGLNSVFSAVKRRARGFRSFEYLRTMLYLVAGKLRLPAI
ncbi:MAG: ISL3 family transposase [Verrucomicrobia bacterium]|nr:ISL3 family transposase [Verrucomicrobiota bacterium]